MKCLNNKFVIIVFFIVLFNAFFMFSKYNLNNFVYRKIPYNMYDSYLMEFKYKYNDFTREIRTVGFYTDVTGEHRYHVLFELQDSIDYDYVFCFSYSNGCENFAKNENMEIKDIYNHIVFCKRKDIK